jgi:hypothetical protein
MDPKDLAALQGFVNAPGTPVRKPGLYGGPDAQIAPYEPQTTREKLRSKVFDLTDWMGFGNQSANDLAGALAGSYLDQSPGVYGGIGGVGLADLLPGLGTYIAGEEGKAAYDRGDYLDAALGGGEVALSMAPIVGPLAKNAVKGGRKGLGDFVADQFGGVPVPDTLTKWLTPADPDYLVEPEWDGDVQALWDLNQIAPPAAPRPVGTIMDPNQYGLPDIGDPLNDATPPKSGELDLGTLIFNLVNKPAPEVLAVTRLLDAGRGDLVTPELYATARRADPDALRGELVSRITPDLATNRAPLGMGERVFHYTQAGRGNLPGSPPFESFEPRRGGFNQTFDSLGPHVGTFYAADARRTAKSSGSMSYHEGNLPPGYAPDFHPDAAPYALVPNQGSMMELAANLEKPFLYGDADALSAEWQAPFPDRWKSYADEGRDRWSEDHINSALDSFLTLMPFPAGTTSREARMALLR